jgi:hypothetical protein
MKFYLIALGILASTSFTLQAAKTTGSPVASGTLHFTGSITAPACAISRQADRLLSNCFDRLTDNNSGYVSRPLEAMPFELVSSVTSEEVNNNPNMKRVIVSYK